MKELETKEEIRRASTVCMAQHYMRLQKSWRERDEGKIKCFYGCGM